VRRLSFAFGCAACFTAAGVQAHDAITTKLTWTQEISRIFYKRCVSCHRENGTAMAFRDYDQVRPWAKAVREEVLERRMPPWGAVPGVGEFRDDPSLTRPEIEMIVNWVEGGAPQGDAIYMPRFPRAAPREVMGKLKTTSLVVASAAPVTLKKALTAAAIRPRHLPAGASMEVTALHPDGAVEHLIWLRDFRAEWTWAYTFKEPLKLPKGTQIAVHAPAAASAAILVLE
jgi:hypothetical protein